jgi:hypothetical protein
MNERIRELASQAFVITTDGKISYVSDYMVEKFAESLVKECAEVTQDFVDHRFPASEYPIRLKRYFGIA